MLSFFPFPVRHILHEYGTRWNTLGIVYKANVYKIKSLIRQIGNAGFGATKCKYDVICKTGALIR